MKYSLETWGSVRTLHLVNLLGFIAYAPMLVRNLWVQALTCILYPLYRGFLYATLTTFGCRHSHVSSTHSIVASSMRL